MVNLQSAVEVIDLGPSLIPNNKDAKYEEPPAATPWTRQPAGDF